jgi:hypothetical protein
MNDQTQSEFSNGTIDGMSEAEETLRLIARLPEPDGLEKRVLAGLAVERTSGGPTARVLEWPAGFRPASDWMRAAAAAAIVFVVVGGGWGVYSRVQPPPTAKVIVMPARVASPGGFSNAGAIRTPHTLNGPTVANPTTVTSPQSKTLPPAAKKPVRKAMTATAKTAPLQPATPAK